MRKFFATTALALVCTGAAFSQELPELEGRVSDLEKKVSALSNLKISGYVQAQWQWNESGVADGTQNTFSVRRGRIKTAYSNNYGQAVMQIDVTEGGVSIKDAYLTLKTPKLQWASFTAGVFDRPFGYEISYSSSTRESPERSKVFLTLFPKERDLGAKLTFKGLKGTALEGFGIEGGLFTGNGGAAKETDSKKDFIGRLGYSNTFGNITFGAGFSTYQGGVRLNGDAKAYKLENDKFVVDNSIQSGQYAKRQYYGFDLQFAVTSVLGRSQIRAEYLWGQQPGFKAKSDSPTGAVSGDIYIRDFSGYYVYFIQDIATTKHTFVAKIDGYDPNRKIKRLENLTDGDVCYVTLGLGWLFRATDNIRIMAYYDIVKNERSGGYNEVSDKFKRDLKDDVFTLRFQYKF
ncbi:MAG: OprO/OprP family phosphate-selective porin [Rikenellaceae bacterium]|nr:OprO/OprP family phosphate-selective porin [Rikenellaceae bacterium]